MDHNSLTLDSSLVSSESPQRKPSDPSLQAGFLASIKGTLHTPEDPSFETYAKIFNGDVISFSSWLVRPFDTEDVSQIVRFCARNSLSISVKAGGYGTHGQAVQGDVIMDMSLLNDIQIESSNAQGGFISLKDMPSIKYMGKTSQASHSQPLSAETSAELLHPSGKRSAEEAFGSRGFPSLSAFNDRPANDVQGATFTPESGSVPNPEISHPNTRRRVWPSGRTVFGPPRNLSGTLPSSRTSLPDEPGGSIPPVAASSDTSRQESSGSGSSEEITSRSTASGSVQSSNSSIFPGSHMNSSTSTSVTSVESHPKQDESSDPFGYMVSGAPTSSTGRSESHILDVPSASSSTQFVSPIPPSFVMDLFSPAGHYMPTRVVPGAPHAYMTFGAGAKQKEIDLHSASHPLPATSLSGDPCFTPYHVPFSAHPVGSSVMLLGGFGFLSRLHGLSLDNLVEAEMVLADGSVVIVNEEENSELFWALRGAGPAFGIVTRYKAKAYPVPVVFAGNIIYKFHRATAPSLIKHFRDCVKNVPRELYANVILTAGPDRQALVVIQICYLGSQEQGIEFLQAITSWDGDQCLLNEVSEKSFLSQQDSLAQLIRGKAGRKWFIRSDLLNSLSDEAIHETVIRFSDTPAGCTWLFELSGGNVADEHGGCFPAASRQANWTIAAFHQWELHEDDPRCVTSAEDWINETLAPASAGGPYPSFFGIHEATDRVKRTFGDSWERLCELKQKYDPSGFLKHTFWPLDEHGQFKTKLVPTHTQF